MKKDPITISKSKKKIDIDSMDTKRAFHLLLKKINELEKELKDLKENLDKK
jgi:prefoldin subunit 5